MIGRIGHEKAGSAAMRDEQGRHTGGSHDIVSSRKVVLIVGKGKAEMKFTKHKPDRDETRFIRTLHDESGNIALGGSWARSDQTFSRVEPPLVHSRTSPNRSPSAGRRDLNSIMIDRVTLSVSKADTSFCPKSRSFTRLSAALRVCNK